MTTTHTPTQLKVTNDTVAQIIASLEATRARVLLIDGNDTRQIINHYLDGTFDYVKKHDWQYASSQAYEVANHIRTCSDFKSDDTQHALEQALIMYALICDAQTRTRLAGYLNA